jgi:hypothetical protein
MQRKEKEMKFRNLNRLFAKVFGYGWGPCVVCKKDFGGLEWKTNKPHSTLWLDSYSGKAVCPECTGSQFVIENNQKAGRW